MRPTQPPELSYPLEAEPRTGDESRFISGAPTLTAENAAASRSVKVS